jgi:hypothetical protein
MDTVDTVPFALVSAKAAKDLEVFFIQKFGRFKLLSYLCSGFKRIKICVHII